MAPLVVVVVTQSVPSTVLEKACALPGASPTNVTPMRVSPARAEQTALTMVIAPLVFAAT